MKGKVVCNIAKKRKNGFLFVLSNKRDIKTSGAKLFLTKLSAQCIKRFADAVTVPVALYEYFLGAVDLYPVTEAVFLSDACRVATCGKIGVEHA